ncbi:hypothetical protein HMF3257_24315 [Spirosoma telluris]|uniref:Uncharacterized protein n=2 Tax=Spirosoma telluris TaxID=2183553 RepID=A0A327NMT6_9BACT|nr:hypothetical protein HMF3257_24315 [Spirosoma telluris]
MRFRPKCQPDRGVVNKNTVGLQLLSDDSGLIGMRRIIPILILWLTLFSCRDEATVVAHTISCEVKNPLLDLPWLKRIIAEGTNPYLQVEEGQYQKQTVYIVSTCISCFAGGMATIYRCDGVEICHFGTYILDPNPSCKYVYEEEITNRKTLLSR